MRYLPLSLLPLSLACSGPMAKPMVDRLDDEAQATVDATWDNLMTPPDAVDRQLLLDSILAGQLHQHGVDSLSLISEKRVGGGLVVMEVRFDRADPMFDEFSVSYIDARGREVRRERFARDEVNAAVQVLLTAASEVGQEPDTTADETEQQQRADRRERLEAVQEILAPMNENASSMELASME